LADFVSYVTGWDFAVPDLLHLGEIRLNLLRVFNAREGFSREHDTLPKKLFLPRIGGETDGVRITEEELEAAITMYYRMAGWDHATGTPTRKKLEALDLTWAADLLD
jgi:aldehyde:ferredoxin oxidoreductase